MLQLIILPFGAFILALISIIAMVLVAAAAARWRDRLFSYLMLLILSASIGTIFLSGRVLRMEFEGLSVASEGDMGSTLLAKLLLIAVIGCSVTLCVAWFLNFRKQMTPGNRFENRGMHTPNDIVIAFMMYYIAFSILPLIFAPQYYFHVALIYPFFIFLALFLWMRLSNVDPVVVIKQCLAIIVFASLGAAVLVPQLAVQPSYMGLIPGFNSRLWGLTAGPNALGSVAGLLLVLEAAEPSARKWLRNSIFLAAALALVLTQSKTSILAALLGLLIIYGWRLATGIQRKTSGGGRNETLIITVLIGTFVSLLVVAGAWAMFFDTAILSSLERKLDARAIGDLTHASGRTWIWTVAIQGGLENPLFGQGLGFWSVDNRLRWGLGGAVHAHNLFLQAFSRAGFVGLAALLVFLYFVYRYSLRAAQRTRGASIALAAMFLVRAAFEVPLQPNAILGAEFFPMMAFFLYVIDRGAKSIQKTGLSAPIRTRYIKVAGVK